MNIGKWFVMLVAMLALTGMVMAVEDVNGTSDVNDNATQGQALSVRYDHMLCKIDFTNTQIDLFAKYVPTVDLSSNKAKLLADADALKVFLDNKDRDGFDAYITETAKDNMQNATQSLNDAKKNFKQYNLTNETRTSFISDLKDAKEIYSECISDKELKMAKVMETHMENWNKQWKNVANKMAEKNMTMADAEALQTEIAAKNAELSALIASGNMTQIREFMKTYHEDQLHYAARFEIARLKGYRDKLEPIAGKYNMSDRLHNIDAMIADAEKNAQPGNRYAYGEFKNTWDDIKNAGKDMQNAAKEINAERMKERQGKIAERQEQLRNESGRKLKRLNNSNGSVPPRLERQKGSVPLNNGDEGQ